MHLAMKRDQEHVKWGSKNGLKVDYTDWSEAMKIAKRILQIIEAKPEKSLIQPQKFFLLKI